MYTKGISTQPMSESIVKAPVEMPELYSHFVNTPLPKFIMQNFIAPEQRELIAMVDGKKNISLTFQDIYERSYCLANAVRKMNLAPDESIAIVSQNTLHYSTVFLGISLAGLRSTCINPLNSEAEMLYQVQAANVKVIIAHPFNLHTCLSVAEKIPGCQVIVFDDHEVDAMNTDIATCTRLSQLIKRENFSDIDTDSFLPQATFDPNSILTVPFSSGTTGPMKGVLLSHKNVVSNVLQIMPYEGTILKKLVAKTTHAEVKLPMYNILSNWIRASVSVQC